MGEDKEFNLFSEGKSSTGIYLRTDEHLEFIDALKTSANFSKEVLDNSYAWKWLILALHASLQGACVCALESIYGQSYGSLSDSSRKKYVETITLSEEHQDILVEYNNGDRKRFDQLSKDERDILLRKPRMADLLTLYKRIKNSERLRPPYTFRGNENIQADIKSIKDLRNNFIHFVPKGWSINLSGMPHIVSCVTEVIEHLAVKHCSFPQHLSDEDKKQIEKSLKDIRNNVAQWARLHDIQVGPRPTPG